MLLKVSSMNKDYDVYHEEYFRFDMFAIYRESFESLQLTYSTHKFIFINFIERVILMI